MYAYKKNQRAYKHFGLLNTPYKMVTYPFSILGVAFKLTLEGIVFQDCPNATMFVAITGISTRYELRAKGRASI